MNPYTQLTVGAAIVLIMEVTFIVGVFYLIWRLWRTRGRRPPKALVVAIAVVMFMTPLAARQETSCFGNYVIFTSKSWQLLEQCIVETNDKPWYERLGTRTICNANWLSDSQQAWMSYVSCMGFSGIKTLVDL